MLAAVGAYAQAISFTVQVIAVSDQAAAVDISRGLLRDGFPAYVVRSTGGQGDVYRVRVGAFANRAAAVRYAAAMPDVAGARPVPALAEAIPGGIMPLAPRVLWEGPVAGEDLRVLPWPDGVAVRRQAIASLRQATYTLVQGAEVRTVQAWRLAPLAEMPPPLGVDLLDVPFIDLTVDPAAEGAPDEAVPPEEPPAGPGDDAPDTVPADEEGSADEGDGAPEAEDSADEGDGAPEAEGSADEGATAAPEAGLVLLRDRALWPPGWADDGDEVREAYRVATLALVSTRLDVDPEAIAAAAYLPGGEPPPALVVVELSDRSGRDLGDIRGLGDPNEGIRPEGPPPLAGSDTRWWPEADLGTRVRLDAAAEAALGGEAWALENDAGFVRIVTADGTQWRAVAGVLLWSDGRYALVRDGDEVVLVDFTAR
jgi:hypothetical protein